MVLIKARNTLVFPYFFPPPVLKYAFCLELVWQYISKVIAMYFNKMFEVNLQMHAFVPKTKSQTVYFRYR